MLAFVCVKTFPNRAVAEIARCALQAEGIESTVSAEDTGYDIALACGGARLLVEGDSVDAAREILTTLDSDSDDEVDAPERIQFRLSTLFALTTLAALAAAGYAYFGPQGAISGFFSSILAIIGVQILLSLQGRRPFNKFFVATAGVGFLVMAVLSLFRGILN